MATSRSFGETSFITFSPKLTVPEEMVSKPAIIRSTVVFPQPGHRPGVGSVREFAVGYSNDHFNRTVEPS
jgi:hypothetical protein